jgi:hypothetical protein
LSLNENDVQEMTTQLREGLAAKTPLVVLSSEVEIDEVYVVAGRKGNPAAVEKRPQGRTQQIEGRARTRNARKGKAANSTTRRTTLKVRPSFAVTDFRLSLSRSYRPSGVVVPPQLSFT